jgi:hypothetical protein
MALNPLYRETGSTPPVPTDGVPVPYHGRARSATPRPRVPAPENSPRRQAVVSEAALPRRPAAGSQARRV